MTTFSELEMDMALRVVSIVIPDKVTLLPVISKATSLMGATNVDTEEPFPMIETHSYR